MEEKTFAIMTKDSVQLMAEGAGHSGVSDEVASLLGEDVTYRLREAVIKSSAYMKNAKRRRLCPEDFNQALFNSDVPPILGHGSSTDAATFRQTRDGELHFVEDPDINLNNAVFNSYVPKSLGKVSVKGQWLAVEGVNKFQTHGNSHSAYRNAKKEIQEDLLEYYSQITKALLGSHTVIVKWALADLSTNVGVIQLLPYFVNFVAKGVKAAGHDVLKLSILLRTVEALIHNQHLFLETQPYLNLLVQSLESCLLEPLPESVNQQSMDHWTMRQFAASLLASLVRKCNNETNHLHSSVTKRLSENLQDLTRPFCSHYGAVMALMEFGATEVKRILVPHLESLLAHVMNVMDSPHISLHHVYFDALQVYGAIQLANEKMLKEQIDGFLALHGEYNKTSLGDDISAGALYSACDMVTLYQQLSAIFGDTLCIQLPVLELSSVFPKHHLEDLVTLGDADSRRSGEDLLADLMQEVRKHEQEKHDRQKRQQLFDTQFGESDRGLFHSAEQKYTEWTEGENADIDNTYQDQMAVSSTISDPTKGTLKLKIKRQTQGQGSPSIQHGKSRPESELHRQGDLNPKKKRKQHSRNQYDCGGAFDNTDFSDSEELQFQRQHFMETLSTIEESGDSDVFDFHRKGKLKLKLKVPTNEPTSD